MVHWLKVANRSLACSNRNSFVPAFGPTLTCSPRRVPVLNSVVHDQRSLSAGAANSAKLFISRRLLFGSVVLAAGAIAAWNVRKQNVDLHADSGQVQGHTGRRPLVHRGTRVFRVHTCTVSVDVIVRAGVRPGLRVSSAPVGMQVNTITAN